MSDIPNSYGILLNKDAKIHRQYFKEMAKLLGISCKYQAPLDSKEFNIHGDLNTHYYPPLDVNCILEEHPDQKSLKKMGWVAELGENSLMLHVPYDLPHLEVGALFTLPGGLDESEGRIFRVISMKNIMIYPASITCEIAPEYETTTEPVEIHDFSKDNFTLLKDNDGDD